MNKIKVTGFLAVNDLEEHQVDLNSPTGLSEGGFEELTESLGLEEITFDLIEDD